MNNRIQCLLCINSKVFVYQNFCAGCVAKIKKQANPPQEIYQNILKDALTFVKFFLGDKNAVDSRTARIPAQDKKLESIISLD